MTGPNDPLMPTPGPSSDAWTDAPEQAIPPADPPAPESAGTLVPGLAVPAADEPPAESPPPDAEPRPAGWAPPPAARGSGCLKGCVIAAFLGFVLMVVAVIGLIFLGGQVQSILGGTTQFGTSGSGCSVNGASTTFTSSDAIHVAAYFSRDVTAGETVTAVLSYPDGSLENADQVVDETSRCMGLDITAGQAAGHYSLEFTVGSELVSRGEFDIAP